MSNATGSIVTCRAKRITPIFTHMKCILVRMWCFVVADVRVSSIVPFTRTYFHSYNLWMKLCCDISNWRSHFRLYASAHMFSPKYAIILRDSDFYDCETCSYESCIHTYTFFSYILCYIALPAFFFIWNTLQHTCTVLYLFIHILNRIWISVICCVFLFALPMTFGHVHCIAYTAWVFFQWPLRPLLCTISVAIRKTPSLHIARQKAIFVVLINNVIIVRFHHMEP